MITIDTHAIIKDFIAIGIPEKQAEILVARFTTKEEFNALEKEHLELATKKDLKQVETVLRNEIKLVENEIKRVENEIKRVEVSLRHEINQVELNLRNEMSNNKYDILKWMIPLSLTMIGLIITMMGIMIAPLFK